MSTPPAWAIVDPVELLTVATLTLGLVTTLAAGCWWLLAPRVRDFVRDLAGVASSAAQQLDATVPGSTAAHAATAATAADELPAVRRQLDQLAGRVGDLVDAQLVTRMQLVELQTERHDQRLSSIEQLQLQLVASGFIPTHRPPTREDPDR